MKSIFKLTGSLVLSLIVLCGLSACSGQTSNGTNGLSGSAGSNSANSTVSFAGLVPKVEPTIVRIDVTVARGSASGSGTIVDSRGYILTNDHVVSGAKRINVTFQNGTALTASVVAADPSIDLALLKVDTTRSDFPVMPLGTMADVIVGEPVMAVGFPGGSDLPGPATFSQGVISAMRPYQGVLYIQTDTPVNPGNSGGCLFALNGSMIGVPAAYLTPANQDFEDINLAIPIDQVKSFLTKNLPK